MSGSPPPGNPGRDLEWLDAMPDEIQGLVRDIADRPDFPELLAKLSGALSKLTDRKQHHAEELACRAWELAPDDALVRVHAEWALRRRVPRWHFQLLADQARNQLYRDALQQLVTPQTTVLEIGTGTGILAMLAAQAGARHVYTCEMEPLIADAARENIERNGLADRITVIARRSTELRIPEDLPAPADLLVSETVDNGLLGELVLPMMEDARSRLLRPDAVVLPAEIGSCGVLVGGERWTRRCRLGTTLGFDLSAFNRLGPPAIALDRTQVCDGLDDAFCPPVELFSFDLQQQTAFPAEERTIRVPVVRDGSVDGFLAWIRLRFSDDLSFENAPPCDSVWRPMLHLFPRPLEVRAGELVSLRAKHDRRRISVWV